MASISSIDVDQNLAKVSVNYVTNNKFMQNLDKNKMIKAGLAFLLVITFILACKSAGTSSNNNDVLTAIQDTVAALSDEINRVAEQMKNIKISNNKTLEKFAGELNLLSLSRHCPNRWVLFSGLCYYFSGKDETATWEDAKNVCKRMNKDATLAMPKSQKENNFLKKLNNLTEGSAVHPDLWLGGSDLEVEGVWKWVDGTQIPMSLQDENWAIGEPNNAYGGTQHCLAKYFRGTRNFIMQRFWDDAVCEAKKQFICTFDPQFDCPRGWVKNRESCYYVSGILAPWREARTFCKTVQNNSDLVTFADLDEAVLVQSLIKERSRFEEVIWVGASDLRREGDWKWVGGGSVGDSLWNSGEPNNQGGEHCAMINKSRKMNDALCSKKFLFVCEMPTSENGFVPVLTLGDHLTNIDKDIQIIKANLTEMKGAMN